MRIASWCTFAQVTALAVAAGGSRPVAGAEEGARVVAVFPLVVEGHAAPEIITAVEVALTEGAPSDTKLRVLHGDELQKKLKKNPKRAVNRCQRRRVAVTCFARLASKIRADELLVGRAKATADGVAVILLAIGRNRSVAPRGQFEVQSAEEVQELLTDEKLREFFGLPAVAAPPPAPEAIAAAEVTEAAEARGTTESNEPQQPSDSGRPPEEGLLPDTGTPSAGSHGRDAIVGVPVHEAPGVAVAHRAPALAALNPLTTQPPPSTESAVSVETGPGWLIYTGIALAAVAVGGMSYGGYLGFRSNDVRSSMDRNTVTQAQAVEKAERANKLAREANLWMGVGGGVMALSITFVGIDLFVD